MRLRSSPNQHRFRHPSVALLGVQDPVTEIQKRASSLVLEALQKGWSGPPFDPLKLAELQGISVTPSDDVTDARAVPEKGGGVRIEYNPSKNLSRIRFSVAHELGHVLFPDCAKEIRYRLSHTEAGPNDWELEMLCNLAAAEFLMPAGSFPELKQVNVSIDSALELRRTYQVSTEAILLRLSKLTRVPCAVFAASAEADAYSFNYVAASRNWNAPFHEGQRFPFSGVVDTIRAVGFTAKEQSEPIPGVPLRIEAVGIPAFSGSIKPRLAGLLLPRGATRTRENELKHVLGDATTPAGKGVKIICHVVNDKTPNWGAGFGLAVKKKWPDAQRAFQNWATQDRSNFKLGEVFHSPVSIDTIAFQMVCQHGYGPSPIPRLRYAALRECLIKLATFAVAESASVHMPRIGSGQAGGSWGLIEQLLDEILVATGVQVTVYDLPFQQASTNLQDSLFKEISKV
jgi:hypothetical protein